MIKLITLGLTLITACYAAEPIQITTPVEISASKAEHIFAVSNNGVQFKDSVIREIAFGENITISYKNITAERISPKFTLKLYNQYGFLLTSEKVSASIFGGTSLAPNELGADKLYVEWINYKEIFKHSNFSLPKNFNEVKWVSISNANFKLQK